MDDQVSIIIVSVLSWIGALLLVSLYTYGTFWIWIELDYRQIGALLLMFGILQYILIQELAGRHIAGIFKDTYGNKAFTAVHLLSTFPIALGLIVVGENILAALGLFATGIIMIVYGIFRTMVEILIQKLDPLDQKGSNNFTTTSGQSVILSKDEDDN